MNAIHYIGFDVHKKTIAYCVKTADGHIVEEGTLQAQRMELCRWAKRRQVAWQGAMEATLFSAWIYDTLKPYAQQLSTKLVHETPVALPTAVGGTTFVARNFSLPEEGKCSTWSGYTIFDSTVILTSTGVACLSSDSTALTVSVSSNDPAWLGTAPPVNDYIQLKRLDSTQPFRGEDTGVFGYPAESWPETCTSDLLNLPSSHL